MTKSLAKPYSQTPIKQTQKTVFKTNLKKTFIPGEGFGVARKLLNQKRTP